MSIIRDILSAQEKFLEIEGEWVVLKREYDQLNTRYPGGYEQRKARIEEIKRQFYSRLTIASSEHGELDARHNPREDNGNQIFNIVSSCPACDRILEAHGLKALQREGGELTRAHREVAAAVKRLKELGNQAKTIVAEINQLGLSLGLPSFQVDDPDNGFVTTGNIAAFSIRGRPILDSGIYVEYKVGSNSYYAVLDPSETIVAYYTGSGGWHLTGDGRRYTQHLDDEVRVKVSPRFSYSGQSPETDIVIAIRDGSGDRHHIVFDDHGNVIIDELHRGEAR